MGWFNIIVLCKPKMRYMNFKGKYMNFVNNKNLIVLTGPTAVGKTDLSIKLAKIVNGEIISADSIQVYKHLDIGSAKITFDEMEGVKHHLIDVLDPREGFNIATFKELADKAIDDIYSRGKLPIITGGTGFYIQAVLYDIDFTENEENSEIRSRLEALAEENPQYLVGKINVLFLFQIINF